MPETANGIASPGEDFPDIEESEPVERYDQGLYYPVCIGEVLASRYRIEHKLGWGGYSTVWMAYDMLQRKDVALKILIPGEKGEYEYHMQKEIVRIVRDISHLVTLQDKTPSRSQAMVENITASWCCHYSAQVSDLNEGALMWEMSLPLTEDDTAKKYEQLGRPKKWMLGYLWKKGELVEQVKITSELLGSKLYLGDFGLTIKEGTSVRTKQQTPYCFCAPERLHGGDPSFASDMWSYMCFFAALYFGANVFYGNGGKSTVFSWVEQLGSMPEEWKGRFWLPDEVDDIWYDPITTPDPERDLAARIARIRPDTSQSERELVLSVLLKAFCYLPERRLSAEQLLKDPSFVALTEIYQC